MDRARFVASPRTPDEHKPAGVGYYALLAARTWIKFPCVDLRNPLFPQPRAPPTVVEIPRDPIGVVPPDIFGMPGRGRKL